MKKLLQLSLVFLLFAGILSGCNLSKTAVVKDTVKSVITTTSDYYKYYDPVQGLVRIQDTDYFVRTFGMLNADLEIELVPIGKESPCYYKIKSAGSPGQDTALSPDPSKTIKCRLGDLVVDLLPRR